MNRLIIHDKKKINIKVKKIIISYEMSTVKFPDIASCTRLKFFMATKQYTNRKQIFKMIDVLKWSAMIFLRVNKFIWCIRVTEMLTRKMFRTSRQEEARYTWAGFSDSENYFFLSFISISKYFQEFIVAYYMYLCIFKKHNTLLSFHVCLFSVW